MIRTLTLFLALAMAALGGFAVDRILGGMLDITVIWQDTHEAPVTNGGREL